MSNTDPVPAGKIGDIVKAEAKIAMPDVMDVFISEYENKLYERKGELTDRINQLRDDLPVFEKQVLKDANFSEFAGLKIAKLKVETVLAGEPVIRWKDKQSIYRQEVTLVQTIDNDDGSTYKNKLATLTKEKNIKAGHVTEYKRRTDEIAQVESDLQKCVAAIGDMSRKERQVKARISKLRLQEQGLDHMLNDPEMAQLIHVG